MTKMFPRYLKHTISQAASSNGFPESIASSFANSDFLSVIYTFMEIVSRQTSKPSKLALNIYRSNK